METGDKLQDFKVGSVPTVIYIPDFITNAEETQLWNHIYQAPISKWKSLKNRRLQNWGGVVHEKGLLSQDLPPWLTKVTQRIYEVCGFYPAAPNHVLINEYLPDQGIMPHQDGPAYFPAASILSLGEPAVMNFTPHSRLPKCNDSAEASVPLKTTTEAASDNSPTFSLVLIPRSLLIFKDLAYSDYLHGIQDNALHCYDGAINLTQAFKDSVLPSLRNGADSTTSVDAKTFERTSKRISLTCRLVLKVRKNLIKI